MENNEVMENNKIYVLDTNVLLYDSESIFAFKGANVAIPIFVLEELDRFKAENTDIGRSARVVNRHLDKLRARGSLRQGVRLDSGGILKVLFVDKAIDQVVMPFRHSSADNAILAMASVLKNQGFDVKFISKDINARVKADVLGIEAQDYLKDAVTEEDFYKGWIRVQAPAVQLKREFPEILRDLSEEKALEINEFVVVESQHNPHNNKLFRYIGSNKFIGVDEPRFSWPLKPRNVQQTMALNLMMDPNIQMVSLIGKAGSGKTFLALLAGLQHVVANKDYKKILVSRPVIPLGRDIGYLPGDVQEKLHSWMLPVYDNIELILHHAREEQERTFLEHFEKGERDSKGKKTYKDKRKKEERDRLGHVEELVRQGKLSLEAITYMRGRSIPYQFILIDEVQNLTPHEVKTLVTRVGEGSKIILAGDPFQIDSPYLDFSTNGLVLTSQKFKGQNLYGTVYLETSERSDLSQLANKLL